MEIQDSGTGAFGSGWDRPTARQACGPVGGLAARDQRASAWQTSVKPEHNGRKAAKAYTGVTTGRIDERFVDPMSDYARLTMRAGAGTSRSARRRARKAAAAL